MTKQEFKDKYGNLQFTFSYWYKNDLVYIHESDSHKLAVVITPDYRDTLECKETINSMTQCEDYQSIRLYDVTGDTMWEKRIFEGEGDHV